MDCFYTDGKREKNQRYATAYRYSTAILSARLGHSSEVLPSSTSASRAHSAPSEMFGLLQ
jgi:hypothetical protein